jgi:hypothetical protein
MKNILILATGGFVVTISIATGLYVTGRIMLPDLLTLHHIPSWFACFMATNAAYCTVLGVNMGRAITGLAD